LARAEEGLLHVMGVLRERDEVRTGFERDTRRLQHPLLNRLDGAAAQGALERLEAPGRPLDERSEGRRPKIGMLPSVRPLYLDGRIGQCVMRAVSTDGNWARVFKSECDRWNRWQ
jgi:hypothetical protein